MSTGLCRRIVAGHRRGRHRPRVVERRATVATSFGRSRRPMPPFETGGPSSSSSSSRGLSGGTSVAPPRLSVPRRSPPAAAAARVLPEPRGRGPDLSSRPPPPPPRAASLTAARRGLSSSAPSTLAEEDEAREGEDRSDADEEDGGPPRGSRGGMWNAVRNQSPYYELQDYYEKRHGIRKGSVLVDAVPVGRGERGRVLWWTATFTCPVTGAVTEAGVARNQAQFVVEDPEGGPSSPRVVYEKKRHAVQAAAARALDVIQYRATGLTEPRFCEEDPSKDAAAAALPAGFASGQSPREEGQQKVAEDHVTVHGISPLRELHTYYQQRHGISKDDLTIDATKVLTSEGSKICWTATFRCPVTQMKYPAGTMRNVTRVTVEEEEGAADVSRILYWKKGHAIHAAAARALDAIRYRDTGQTEPRFCEEDPSKDATTVARPQVVSAPVDDILPGERQPKVVEEEAVEPPVTAPLSKLHDHEENVEGSQNVEWRIKEGPSFQLGMGGVAQHADCSVTGTSGDTVVVTTVCTEETDGNPFLTVDYRHLSASAGLIPAGVRRKDAWQNPANVTAARAVDRALRPLYAGKGHAHVDCTVHATGRGHPVALAINAAAASVPLKEPVAAVALAVTEDGTVIPNEWNTGETDDVLGELLLACTRSGKVVMLEWTGNSLVEQEWASLLSLAVASVQAALETVLEGASLWAPEQEDLTATLREQLGLPESAQESVVEEKDLVAELQSLAVDYCRERLKLPTQRLFGMDPENSGTRRDFSVDTASIYTGAPLLSKRVRGMREQIMQQEVAAVVNEFLNQQNTPNDTSLLSEEEKARLCELTADELFRQALWQSAHLSGARADGRPFPDGWKTVRPVQVGVPALPESVHGSALFKRGETRVLCTVTLGSPREGLPRVDPQNRIRGLSPKQEKDSSSGYESLPVGSLRFLRTQEALESDFNSRKSRADRERTGDSGTLAEVQRAFLQYDFPAYSTGEVPTGSRQKQRRSIGHGALAERAIKAVLPDPHDFPYSIRMTSEVTDSNGSSSMASVCGTCLALLDAGVPLKEPVAGVSVGLAVNKDADDHDEDRYSLLLDITGTEDHYGGMDFKIAGTCDAETAMQLDVKEPVPVDVLIRGLELARAGRRAIINEMDAQAQSTLGRGLPHRPEPKESAPRVAVVRFDPQRKRDLVGPGGVVLRQLEERYGVSVDLTQEGQCLLYGADRDMVDKARKTVMDLVADVVEGEVYHGTVVEIKDFGAVVELLRNKEGLLHVSELVPDYKEAISGNPKGAEGFVRQHLRVGQTVEVLCTGVDPVNGSVKLSRKALFERKNER